MLSLFMCWSQQVTKHNFFMLLNISVMHYKDKVQHNIVFHFLVYANRQR